MKDSGDLKAALESLCSGEGYRIVIALEAEIESLRVTLATNSNAAEKVIETHKERLAQAMKRAEDREKERATLDKEMSLQFQDMKKRAEELEAENTQLKEEIKRLDSHPEVREKKRQEILRQAASLLTQAEALKVSETAVVQPEQNEDATATGE